MSNISKRRREGSRTKIKSMGDHGEFLQRIRRTLYYGKVPSAPGLSLPLTEISCEQWSLAARGRSVRRLRAAACARVALGRVSPAALVLALLYLERLPPAYRADTPPDHIFLVSLMVSNKFLQDDGEDEEVDCCEWAAAGQLAPEELRRLEARFLAAIEWNVYVSEERFEQGLARLERRVALKQAVPRGFFTYSDLACATAGAGGGAGGAALGELALALAAAALACAASLLALLGSALVVAHALPALARHQPRPALQPAPLGPLATPLATPLTHCVPNCTAPQLPSEGPPAARQPGPGGSSRQACCARGPRRARWPPHAPAPAPADAAGAPCSRGRIWSDLGRLGALAAALTDR